MLLAPLDEVDADDVADAVAVEEDDKDKEGVSEIVAVRLLVTDAELLILDEKDREGERETEIVLVTEIDGVAERGTGEGAVVALAAVMATSVTETPF